MSNNIDADHAGHMLAVIEEYTSVEAAQYVEITNKHVAENAVARHLITKILSDEEVDPLLIALVNKWERRLQRWKQSQQPKE